MEKFSAEWVRVWLRDRDETKLHSWSNVLTLSFGFIDFDTSEYVFFGVGEIKKDPGLYKLYQKLQTQRRASQEPSPMLRGWLRAISQNR